jgi:hypothetical protein
MKNSNDDDDDKGYEMNWKIMEILRVSRKSNNKWTCDFSIYYNES